MAPGIALSEGALSRREPAGLQSEAAFTRLEHPADALALVADDVATSERRLRTLLESDVSHIPEVAGYLADSGGKRLRPALTALGARVLAVPVPRLDALMCVGELIHLGSLLHDDVVDGASARRGRPAAHGTYGNATAVLTGDFCLAKAISTATSMDGSQTAHALSEAVVEMAEGEVLQLRRSGDFDTTVSDYLDVVERKSGALLGWCAAAAAHVVDDTQAAECLGAFGREAGIAFQIADDVLDFCEGTGKEPGVDLLQRKMTLPIVTAMQRLPELRARLEDGPPDRSALQPLIDAVRGCGALEDARNRARHFASAAANRLASLPDNDGRRALERVARFLVERAS